MVVKMVVEMMVTMMAVTATMIMMIGAKEAQGCGLRDGQRC